MFGCDVVSLFIQYSFESVIKKIQVANQHSNSVSQMSFIARFAQGNTFSSIIDVLKGHISEGNFVCTTDGMSFSSMDATHISLVKMNIPSTDFVRYECKQDIHFGVSLVNLAKLVKSASSAGVEITLKMNMGDDAITVISCLEGTDQEITRYCLNLMDIANEEYNIPPRGSMLSAMMLSSDLKSILNNLETIGDTVSIRLNEFGVQLSSSGELGKGEHNLYVANGGCKMKVESGAQFIDRYSACQLRNFSKAAAFSSHVIIKVSPESPLILTFKIFENGRLQFYLAPLLEEQTQ